MPRGRRQRPGEDNAPAKGLKELIGDRPKLLIGEGIDEVNFFGALLLIMGINDVVVEDCGGKDKLLDYLGLLKDRAGFQRLAALGVTRDVDNKDAIGDPADALRSVQDAIRSIALPIPSDSERIEGNSPRVGIYLMPGQGRAGALEDLCLEAASSDPLMACVDAYFACLTASGHPHPRAIRVAKARARVWLACRKEPDLSLGLAAMSTARNFSNSMPPGEEYWPLNSPAFDPLKTFLRDLFVDPSP